VETEHLEFKAEPYRLEHELQKQELAKDVSGLANARGGAILIGFKGCYPKSAISVRPGEEGARSSDRWPR
jgi:hypothetical protein